MEIMMGRGGEKTKPIYRDGELFEPFATPKPGKNCLRRERQPVNSLERIRSFC